MLSMSYSIDYRRRVVEFVEQGGSKLEAARIFNISHATIYNWLGRSGLEPKARGLCDRKLKKSDLAAHIKKFPDAFLRERAVHFGVDPSTICVAMKKLKISKKNDTIL
jgi:putative transposase